jgi:hypothetical protein
VNWEATYDSSGIAALSKPPNTLATETDTWSSSSQQLVCIYTDVLIDFNYILPQFEFAICLQFLVTNSVIDSRSRATCSSRCLTHVAVTVAQAQ